MKGESDDLRRWLEKRLAPEALPTLVWSLLERGGFVGAVLDHEDPGAKDDLEAEARDLLAMVGPQGSGAGSGLERALARRIGRPKPAIGEVERAQTISRYLAKVAGERDDVRRFRADVLGECTLTGDQTVDFLNSPAIRFIQYDAVPSLGIPLAEHRASFVMRKKQGRSKSTWPRDLQLLIQWRKLRKIIPFGELLPADWPRGTPPVSWRLPRDQNRIYFYGSILDQLLRLGSDLAQQYGWNSAKAMFFVVSGRAPVVLVEDHVDHRRLQDHAHCYIRLSIPPWVSAKTVAEIYRFHQRGALGGDNRPISPRNVAIFSFVTERMGSKGAVQSWRSLMKDWNRRNQEAQYAEVRLFHRDYSRAERMLVFPDYFAR